VLDRSGIIYGNHAPEKRDLAHEMRMAMTPAEAHLWRRLKASRLRGIHFRRQQIIDGYIADFYCHEAGVVVEVDGDVHDHQREYDAQRDEVLRRRELIVLRVRNEDVLGDVNEVAGRILKVCLQRARR
jgi:very-short-patch-repair endonuclease